jgi:hypothetical protein
MMHNFYDKRSDWLTPGNHNHYRISRILKSIKLLNTKENSKEFHNFILNKVKQAMPVTFETLEIWSSVISEN